ncbi:hypothetical protein [Microlunatus speluncae]|uniref:hypothetical protein n=1 Tax=Microlunatus speluncae TaxID=2594267 RepID=UPI001375D333|nr:hypothetical protein [Microlunatus speluncae]
MTGDPVTGDPVAPGQTLFAFVRHWYRRAASRSTSRVITVTDAGADLAGADLR